MFDRRPLAVLKAEQVGDVVAAMNFAREHGLSPCAGAAAYYDTAEALGFLVEAVEPPSAMPPTDFTL